MSFSTISFSLCLSKLYDELRVFHQQDSMEREHADAMERMKTKMIEMRTSHAASIEELQKQHNSEIETIKNSKQVSNLTNGYLHNLDVVIGVAWSPKSYIEFNSFY